MLILRHFHIWRKLTDATEDPIEHLFLKSQLRRRCLTSAGVAALGLILGSFPFAFRFRDPVSMTVLLAAALILMCMIILMATLDIFSSRYIVSREKGKSDKAKLDLLKEHERLKEKMRNEKSGEDSTK